MKSSKIITVLILSLSLGACSTVPTTPPDAEVLPSIPLLQAAEENKLETVEATVQKVIDGDTIEVVAITANKDVDVRVGQLFKARYLLLDSPESVGERAPMPFGKEASTYHKQLVEGKKVTLIYDKGDKTDKYGRHLAYVMLDNKLVQQQILEEGYGIIRYVNPPNTTFLSYLKDFEKNARVAHKNVWSIPNYVTTDGYNVAAVDGQILQDKVTGDVVTGSGEVAKDGIEAYIYKEYGGTAGKVYDALLEEEVEKHVDEGVSKFLEVFK